MNGKRPSEETIPEQRRTRIKLASPSPERTSNSDTESIHSCQGYKTELATDTSDISSSPPPPPPSPPPPSPPPSPRNESYPGEYEVVELEEQRLNFFYSDESSEHADIENGFLIPSLSDESFDNALLGDTSEENSTSPTSNSDVDPGLPRNDYLDFERCLMCQTEKKNISYPYCSPCFTWKKNFFPSRPKRKARDFKKHNSKGNTLSDGFCDDSGVGSTETPLSEDTVDGPSQLSQPSTSSSNSSTTSNTNENDNPELCRVCFLKPENGLFVHLNIAHRYGCYSCAKKIWYNNGGCPLCRRKVFKVTQLFI